jgi:hypothetical protein
MSKFAQNRNTVPRQIRVTPQVSAKLDQLCEKGGYTPQGRGSSGLVSDLVTGPEANPENALNEVAIIGSDVGRAMRALAIRIERQADDETQVVCDDCAAILAELQAIRRDIVATLKQALPAYETRVFSTRESHDNWS